jgi:pimeloyl-ACP methyl ester carboxylesterase
MPEIRLRHGEVDGISLHYLVEGRGPAVVLVHGLGGFAESWRHNISHLAEQATVYALDLPGGGQSSKPPARYRLGFFAAALHGFLEAVGIPQASLVGHSLGAAVAVTFALAHPSRVERLAFLGGVVPGFDYRLSLAYRTLAVPGLGECLSLLGCAPLYRAALARCFHAPDRAEIEFLIRWAYSSRTSLAARTAYLTTLRGVRGEFQGHGDAYRRALASLDVPVLIIHGRQDPVIHPAHAQAISGGVPRAAVRWLDACGHFPHIEHPAVLNRWLEDFVAGRTAPR